MVAEMIGATILFLLNRYLWIASWSVLVMLIMTRRFSTNLTTSIVFKGLLLTLAVLSPVSLIPAGSSGVLSYSGSAII